MSKTSNKWEMKLKQADQLRKSGSEALWERVKLIVQVSKDAEFAAWCEENKTDLYGYLDAVVSDFSDSFLTVESVYEMNPKKADWVRHGYRYLLAEWIASREKKEYDSHRYKTMWEASEVENAAFRTVLENPRTKKAKEAVAVLKDAAPVVIKSTKQDYKRLYQKARERITELENQVETLRQKLERVHAHT